MSRTRLPGRVDPLRLAQHGEHLEGTLPLGEMPRLGDATSLAHGNARVELSFGVDGQGVRFLTGSASARVTLECQRCLRPMEFSLEAGFSLGLVESLEAGERLPGPYEPLVLDQKCVELSTVIEDELLLSLPIVALHPGGDCSAAEPVQSPETPRPEPLRGLRDLKLRATE